MTAGVIKIEEKTLTFNVYSYNELSVNAKEEVKRWYLRRKSPYEFKNIVLDDLQNLFPNSHLKVQFSLSYCQGDGLNIYGDLHYRDILDHFGAPKHKKKVIEKYFKFEPLILLEKNQDPLYSYSLKFYQIANLKREIPIYNTLDSYEDGKKDKSLIVEFYRRIYQFFEDLDRGWETVGYEYFYEASEEELMEYCDANELEFLENGVLFKEDILDY